MLSVSVRGLVIRRILGGGVMAIIFRDRTLKSSEKSHYVCGECGVELHQDFAYSHKCR